MNMNARYQLSAPVAFIIITAMCVATGVLLVHAIHSVDFSSVSSENAMAASTVN